MIKKQRQRFRRRKLKCYFCTNKTEPDFKKFEVLQKFISERGKIQARIITGLCAKHQRRTTQAIKQARHLALLPFVA